jgi:hypothetical protein
VRGRWSWRSPDGGLAAPIAAFTAIARQGRNRFAPRSRLVRQGAGAQRRMAAGNYFASRCKAGPLPAAENSFRPPLRGRGRLWQIARM